MISKRVLLVAVCAAVLMVAAGVYGYTLYIQVSSLGSRLDDLQREINLLKYRIGFTNSSETFNFFWGGPIAEKFNVKTFWMNITFQRINETHLIITVKTNYLSYSYDISDYVGIVFDVNHNGEIDREDVGTMYKASYYYREPDLTIKHYEAYHALLDGPYNGSQRFFHSIASTILGESAHTCDFDAELGYIYTIPVDLQELKLTNDLIHVEYDFTVAVEFRFGMALIA